MSGEPTSVMPGEPEPSGLLDVSGLVPSVSALASMLQAALDATSVVPGALHLLDVLVDQVSTAPPLPLDDVGETPWVGVIADGLTSIVGPEVSIDVVGDGDARSMTVVVGDLMALISRGPGITSGFVPPDPPADRSDARLTADTGETDDAHEPIGSMVQILREGETVVDVAIDHLGRVIDLRDVEGLAAAWTEFDERKMNAAFEDAEVDLDEDDAELLAVSDRVRERAERRRQEEAEAAAADAETAQRGEAAEAVVADVVADVGAVEALAPPVPTWVATHVVPDGGMSVWPAPDPALERDPAGPLAPGTFVRVDQRRGDWAEIVTQEGRVGWVDARRLIDLAHPPT